MVHGDVPAGGSTSLAELIDQHGEAIEYDLRHYLRIDLLDVFRGEIRPSQVLRLLSQLPDDGAFAASLMFHAPDRRVRSEPGPWDFRGWGHDRHLLAAVLDAVNVNTRLTGQYEKGKGPKFDPWPRPKRRSVKKAAMSLADLTRAVTKT